MSRFESGRSSKNWMIVLVARVYWIVRGVVDAPSKQLIGLVCKSESQKFWERVARSFLVISGWMKLSTRGKRKGKWTDYRQGPTVLALSYDSHASSRDGRSRCLTFHIALKSKGWLLGGDEINLWMIIWAVSDHGRLFVHSPERWT